MSLKDWSTTPATNATAGAVNWAEGQAPSTVNNSARQMMADVAVYMQDPQFYDLGLTPTYVSGTSFTLVGNQTANYTVGRRFKATVTSGTVYGQITVSSYTSLTTITVTLDASVLDAGLSAVALSILRSDHLSIPNVTLPNNISGNAATASTASALSGGVALGTPASGNLANCTFPTLNQNTTGSSASCTGNSSTATTAITLSSIMTAGTRYSIIAGSTSDTSGSYVEMANCLILTAGTYRAAVYISGSFPQVYWRCYKNGVAFGTVHTVAYTGALVTEDFTFAVGDTVQIFCCSYSGSNTVTMAYAKLGVASVVGYIPPIIMALGDR